MARNISTAMAQSQQLPSHQVAAQKSLQGPDGTKKGGVKPEKRGVQHQKLGWNQENQQELGFTPAKMWESLEKKWEATRAQPDFLEKESSKQGEIKPHVLGLEVETTIMGIYCTCNSQQKVLEYHRICHSCPKWVCPKIEYPASGHVSHNPALISSLIIIFPFKTSHLG